MNHQDEQAIGGLLQDATLRARLSGKRVLVLGADGFLGSYAALALHRLGAEVTLYSRREHPILSHLGLPCHHGDLLTTPVLENAIRGQEVVLDLAGSSGGVESNRDAVDNLGKECAPHLNLFQLASRQSVPPLVLFCSSRTVYGKPQYLPVDEAHPLAPQSIYAVHKRTLEDYLRVLNGLNGLPYLIFRLSNPYGPFPWQLGKAYGILNQFILKGTRSESLPIFGDGRQLRDYIHVEDVIRAFLLAVVTPSCHSETFNLGGPTAISMAAAATAIVQACPGSYIDFKEWPRDYGAIETGDYVTDCAKLEARLGWKPCIGFTEGLQRTLSAYQRRPSRAPTGAGGPQVASRRAGSTLFPWESKRVLVTGAGGSLGSFMCHCLLGLGAQVYALHRSGLPDRLTSSSSLQPVQLDLNEPGSRIEEIFKEVEPQVVFHFAAYPDGRESPELIAERLRVNTTATLKMLQAAQQGIVEAFVVGDSCKVFGNSPVPHRENTEIAPDSSYAASKFAAWALCKIFYRMHHLPVAALRPTIIYGPGQAYNIFSFLAKCIQEERPLVELDGGQQTRDPLFIADAVRAYLLAAENMDQLSGRALPIGGGLEIPVSQLSRRFVAASGRQIEIRCCEERMRSGEILRSLCDNLEARTFMNWSPSLTLDEGLSITAEYLLSPVDQQWAIEQAWHSKVVAAVRGK